MKDSVLNKINDWAQQAGYGAIDHHQRLSGGCINESYRLFCSTGATLFVKFHHNPPADFFSREAAGLVALGATHTVSVPRVLKVDRHFLLLQDLQPVAPNSHYWQTLGVQLARLHKIPQQQFGFATDNYCGTTPQRNPLMADGHQFFAQYRLQFQADRAVKNQLLESAIRKRVDRLCDKLEALIPVQPASLIHGDLWSGNVHISPEGEPVLIDPACYYGWAEAELAMTQLFGGFPPAFYAAYEQENPLQPGWRERLPIYNLYHLLNHLNLFGSGYLGQVVSTLAKYD